MFKLIKDIIEHRELLWILIVRNIKIRYKNSALGFLWTLIGPIMLIAIYAVFLSMMKFKMDLPVLFTGIIVWQFLAMCLGDSLAAITGNANLITKTAFPRIVLPLSMVLANLINFLLSSIVLVGYLLISGVTFGNLIYLVPVVITQVALCLGVSLVISTANVFVRDTEHVLGVVMLAWFFMTPIIYPFQMVADKYVSHLAAINPMTGIVSAYRAILLSQPEMSFAEMKVSFCLAWLILGIGLVIFQRARGRFADEL